MLSSGVSEARRWLVGWLEQRGRNVPQSANVNFVSSGILDSFGVIELIEETETQFSIQFGQEQFQDMRFQYIEGLAEIINELSGR